MIIPLDGDADITTCQFKARLLELSSHASH